MQSSIERQLTLAGMHNLRDLGGYAVAEGGSTRWRSVLRSDGLHRLDAEGVAAMKRLGVTTIIDLRHAQELEYERNPFREEEGVAYHAISLFEGLAPTSMEADKVLRDLYIQALTHRGERFAEILTVIAQAPEGIVLFHCTAGKDRTGLVAALLLALVGVEHATVTEDYAMTKALIAPAIEGFVAGAVARGIDPESFMPLLACEPEMMADTLAHLEERHGSIPLYLESIGLDPATLTRLRARLVMEAAAPHPLADG